MDRSDLIFWTDILTNHAEFQINAFPSQEQAYIQEAGMFKNIFQNYHMNLQTQQYVNNTLEPLQNDVINFINFKKKIINELLRCHILINFSPSFINHMINEANEFLSLFDSDPCPEKTRTPAAYIKIWIADASGHTSAILSSVDASETLLLRDTQYYKMKFEDLFKKSSEMEMIQTNLKDYQYVQLLKTETVSILRQFIDFCKQLLSLINTCRVMANGTFNSTIVSHFIKEHEYVIRKIMTCIP